MQRFRPVFWRWFAALMLFFLVANLAGLIRPTGLKPFRYVGFPFTVAAWGFGINELFDGTALALNVLVALGVSSAVAALCAAWRIRRARVKEQSLPRQSGRE